MDSLMLRFDSTRQNTDNWQNF